MLLSESPDLNIKPVHRIGRDLHPSFRIPATVSFHAARLGACYRVEYVVQSLSLHGPPGLLPPKLSAGKVQSAGRVPASSMKTKSQFSAAQIRV